jgi:hypothetical protein
MPDLPPPGKVCPDCGLAKDAAEFGRNKCQADGLAFKLRYSLTEEELAETRGRPGRRRLIGLRTVRSTSTPTTRPARCGRRRRQLWLRLGTDRKLAIAAPVLCDTAGQFQPVQAAAVWRWREP